MLTAQEIINSVFLNIIKLAQNSAQATAFFLEFFLGPFKLSRSYIASLTKKFSEF